MDWVQMIRWKHQKEHSLFPSLSSLQRKCAKIVFTSTHLPWLCLNTLKTWTLVRLDTNTPRLHLFQFPSFPFSIETHFPVLVSPQKWRMSPVKKRTLHFPQLYIRQELIESYMFSWLIWQNWLPRRVMSAWRVAGILHALEGWNVHECGNMMFDIEKIWQASLDNGFRPFTVSAIEPKA